MICNNCLRRLALPSHLRSAAKRTYSTPVTTQTSAGANPRPDGRPAATSRPEHAQPFSTPLTPTPKNQNLSIQPQQTKAAAPRILSSVPAGTVLKGLNFVKGKSDPVALEDSEYPDWLWSVLEKKTSAAGLGAAQGDESDLFCMLSHNCIITDLRPRFLVLQEGTVF
jgi:large subunit ribosomal protein L54